MIERERVIEIAVSIVGVGAMLAMLYVVGGNHASEAADGHHELSATGGELIIYSMIVFIVLMAIAGIVLLRTVTVPEAEHDADSA